MTRRTAPSGAAARPRLPLSGAARSAAAGAASRISRADDFAGLQPEQLRLLVDGSRRDGWHFVARMVEAREASLQPGSRVYLAWQGDAVVGLLLLVPDPTARASRAARLRRIYVVPDARGAGTGAALLRAAIADATGVHEHLVVHAERPSLAGLVESQGFRPATEEPEATHRLVLPFR